MADERLIPTLRELEAMTRAAERSLDQIAEGAASDAGVDAELLSDYLQVVIGAAGSGRPPAPGALERFRETGERAAIAGVPLPAAVDLYLSASWRLWRSIADAAPDASGPALAQLGEIVLRAADDAVAALAHGYVEAQRIAIRREESARREFVDDLLAGVGDPDRLEATAESFGLNLSAAHRVVVAEATRASDDPGPVLGWVGSQVFSRFGSQDVIVTTKDRLLVCVFPEREADAATKLAGFLEETAEREWRLAIGPPEEGPFGPARSFRLAVETLRLAERLGSDDATVRWEELRPFHLLARDPTALRSVVDDVLGGLDAARGGRGPLLETIDAYVAESGNITATARRLFLSPRAVTYRLSAIEKHTGLDPTDADDRFVLELAARGRKLLGDA
ncbi:MAG TPA: helix-turn-helix domain-containing protein [Actinomycetota bacterium]|nr:helix-turn-helix domain-containing protein [Actinomycetota bacterium]